MVKNSLSSASFSVDPVELKGKRALVTGGTRGIGARLGRRLLAGGSTVAASARTAVPELPGGVTFAPADVGTRDGVRHLASRAVEILGGVDILINTAGAARVYPNGSLSSDDGEWQDALDA